MIIPVIRRILKEDLSKAGQLPPWIDSFLSPLNEFIDRITLSLRNNLTFSDNFSGKQVTVNLTHNVGLDISSGATTKVIGVIPLYYSDLAASSFGWVRKNNTVINVTINFVGGSSTTKADVTLMILYGA